MSTTDEMLSSSKLATSKEYREAFVESSVKRYIPFQVRALRKKKGISQKQLASDSGVTQGVISRAEDPDYGNLTFNTVIRIAAGFDLAFVGKFVKFSELSREMREMSEDAFALPNFKEECEAELARRELIAHKTHDSTSAIQRKETTLPDVRVDKAETPLEAISILTRRDSTNEVSTTKYDTKAA